MRTRLARDAALLLGLAAVYAAVARLGLLLDAVGGFATLVWPPTGLAIAAVVLGSRERWLAWPLAGVWLGAFVVNLWTGAPIVSALGIACGNTLEAIVGAWVLRRPATAIGFTDVRTTIRFIVVTLTCATVASATIGVLSLLAGGVIATSKVIETWRAWWVGDVIGALVVTPVILVWQARNPLRALRSAEVALLGSVLIGVTWFAFAGDLTPDRTFQQLYIVFPVLTWAAIRFGPHGATAATFIVSAIAIACTVAGTGPFAGDGQALSHSLLSLQVFIGFIATTFLILGALAAERDRATRDTATGRLELEAALAVASVARAEAEAASEVKTNFLSLVSHELRAPLATMLLQIERLKLDALADPAHAQLVDRLHTQGHRLHHLIDGLLEYTRLQRGQLAIQSQRFGPRGLVEDCLDEVESQAATKQLTLELDASRAPDEFTSDPHVIRLIVINLITNALKFTERGGVTVGLGITDGALSIAVTDTGRGIPPSDLARIFEPFEQLDPVRSKHVPGVGLGLALVRQMASALGGIVLVESELGRGSTFTLELPPWVASSSSKTTTTSATTSQT